MTWEQMFLNMYYIRKDYALLKSRRNLKSVYWSAKFVSLDNDNMYNKG